ncbi:hypothetical protein [Empedobacter brevis]
MSYKQEIKDSSRNIIWNTVVQTLIKDRKNSLILNEEYIRKLWYYVFHEILIPNKLVDSVDEKYLTDWLSYSEQTYNYKKDVSELKVAYLCGPEPENDLEHLINLGFRIENIYAFESDNEIFLSAIESIKNKFHNLKIFNGKIDEFIKSSFVKFDIIYLDFTTPLFSRSSKLYKSIITLFENRALTDLSCLIVNTTYPDKTEENIDFLTNYFHQQSFYEYAIHEYNPEEEYVGRFVEDNYCYGLYDKKDFRPYIEKNFEQAYSAFQTNFVINYSNHILPISTVVKNPTSVKRIFQKNPEILKNLIKKFDELESVYIEPSDYSFFHFFSALKDNDDLLSKDWVNFISKNDYNKFSLEETVKLFYMFLESIYSKNYNDILSESLQKSIPEIMNSIPDSKFGRHSVFCDVPMVHLWLEMVMNQLGYPYHQNTKNHKRYSYKAKERKMCLDIFTFDQCRSFYDWLPMIEYYGEDLKKVERQMLTRMFMDAIGKHSLNILDRQFFGSALVCINDKTWSENHHFEDRKEIK